LTAPIAYSKFWALDLTGASASVRPLRAVVDCPNHCDSRGQHREAIVADFLLDKKTNRTYSTISLDKPYYRARIFFFGNGEEEVLLSKEIQAIGVLH
jgi:hypothetical protein